MKTVDLVAEIRFRINRGISLATEFKNTIYVSAGLKLMLNLKTITTIILSPFILLAFFIAGALDLDWIKLFQKEAEISTGKYNPYFKEKLGAMKK